MLPLWVFGQDATPPDTVKSRFVPTGIRIGLDAISFVKTRTQNNFSGWELNSDIDLDRYLLALEYGQWSRSLDDASTSAYQNDGTYWRAGVDVNFLLTDPDRNVFFLGFRYGHSLYSESYHVTIADPVWGSIDHVYANTDVTARWLEMTTGIKVKIWRYIWMGYTARMKFGLKTGPTPAMLTSDVPGYGETAKKSTWGFNYQIMIRIPFRDASALRQPKK